MIISNIIKNLANDFAKFNIKAYLVGGIVRDSLLGIASDDIDICLVGVNTNNINIVMQVLNKYSSNVAEQVGEKFPVWIAEIETLGKVDFALARSEKKEGVTRKDFAVNIDNISIEDDLLRRDLTINAIAYDIINDIYIDPFGGIEHLHNKIAHPVSEAFAEDTLRVIRAARFIARFNLVPSADLISICRNLKPTDISNERVGMELYKNMAQATKPSEFFRFLKMVGWINYYFKELAELIGVPQSSIYHPEGDAFEHTMHTIDQANDWFIRTVMLCHDLGKSTTTTISENGKIQAIGHELASLPLLEKMLSNISFKDKKVIKQISILTKHHMVHINKVSNKKAKYLLQELLKNNLTYSQLVEVCRCDVSGRPPLQGYTPDIAQDYVNGLDINCLTPIVTGEHLIQLGLKPCAEFKTILDKCLDMQYSGSLRFDNWKKQLKSCNFPILKGLL